MADYRKDILEGFLRDFERVEAAYVAKHPEASRPSCEVQESVLIIKPARFLSIQNTITLAIEVLPGNKVCCLVRSSHHNKIPWLRCDNYTERWRFPLRYKINWVRVINLLTYLMHWRWWQDRRDRPIERFRLAPS